MLLTRKEKVIALEEACLLDDIRPFYMVLADETVIFNSLQEAVDAGHDYVVALRFKLKQNKYRRLLQFVSVDELTNEILRDVKLKLEKALPVGRLVSGFPTVGKTTLALSGGDAHWVDLDVMPYGRENYVIYIKQMERMLADGVNVLVSLNRGMRLKLHEYGLDYVVVVPNQADKELVRKRMIDRGNSCHIVDDLMSQWDDYFEELYPGEVVVSLDTDEFIDSIEGWLLHRDI